MEGIGLFIVSSYFIVIVLAIPPIQLQSSLDRKDIDWVIIIATVKEKTQKDCIQNKIQTQLCCPALSV